MHLARAIVLSVFAFTPLTLVAQAPPDATMQVDALMERWRSTETPGCAVGVARGGVTLLERAYGMADLERGVVAGPETIYEAGSVSKQFTAAAVVLLAQRGQLSLEDDIRDYVPELPDYGVTITIRHMMNHTSGLRDWGSVAGIAGWGRSVRTHTHDHVVDILSRQSALNFPPGQEYSYSNSGYNLQAVIVERVSGMSFAEFSRVNIFEPVGLSNTQWRDDYRRIVPGRSIAYSPRVGGFSINNPIEQVHGNGGLLTTVGDLLRWNEELRTGDVLGGSAFVEEMHRQGILNDGSTIAYALGLNVGQSGGVRRVSHTGSTSGFRAFLGRYPDQRLSVALLCNVSAVNPGGVGQDIADIYLGDAVQRPQPTAGGGGRGGGPGARPAPWTPTPAELNEFVGTFHSDDAETTLTVSIEGGRLVAHRRPATTVALTPTTADTFNAGGGLGTIAFVRDASGSVVELSVQQARVYDMRFSRVR